MLPALVRLVCSTSLNIKSEEANRLAEELARLTAESMTVAVTQALRERLDRVRCERAVGLADRLLAIGKDCAAHLKGRSVPWITVTCFMTSADCRDDHRHIGADCDTSRRAGGGGLRRSHGGRSSSPHLGGQFCRSRRDRWIP